MSKLLDKQVGFMQAIVKCEMEIKEELGEKENDCKNIFIDRRLYQKTGWSLINKQIGVG